MIEPSLSLGLHSRECHGSEGVFEWFMVIGVFGLFLVKKAGCDEKGSIFI